MLNEERVAELLTWLRRERDAAIFYRDRIASHDPKYAGMVLAFESVIKAVVKAKAKTRKNAKERSQPSDWTKGTP